MIRRHGVIEDSQETHFLQSRTNFRRNSCLCQWWVLCHTYPGMKYRLALGMVFLNGPFGG